MTVRLTEEVESSIAAAVQRGDFASVDDAMNKAARLLLRELGQIQPAAEGNPPDDRAQDKGQAKAAVPRPTTEEEFLNHLMNVGLMTQLPDKAADFDDPDDQPIVIEGEPLSETIVRERR